MTISSNGALNSLISAHDYWAGGPKEQLLTQLRALTPWKDDTSAIAEALALAAGCELAFELHWNFSHSGDIQIITDRTETVNIMCGLVRHRAGRAHSPALLAAVSTAARSIWKLATKYGPVTILDKHSIPGIGGKEWPPHGLARRGRLEGNRAIFPPASTDPRDWQRFLDIQKWNNEVGRVSRALCTAIDDQPVVDILFQPTLRNL